MKARRWKKIKDHVKRHRNGTVEKKVDEKAERAPSGVHSFPLVRVKMRSRACYYFAIGRHRRQGVQKAHFTLMTINTHKYNLHITNPWAMG